jgi:hypothetical protein
MPRQKIWGKFESLNSNQKFISILIMEKLFKQPGFLEPAYDGQHSYRVLPVNSSFIDIWIRQHTLNWI